MGTNLCSRCLPVAGLPVSSVLFLSYYYYLGLTHYVQLHSGSIQLFCNIILCSDVVATYNMYLRYFVLHKDCY